MPSQVPFRLCFDSAFEEPEEGRAPVLDLSFTRSSSYQRFIASLVRGSTSGHTACDEEVQMAGAMLL